ncbi:MAG TPA: hypothetical protein VGO90_04020, partial [Chthoniobacteraceae bacterium]|nr:hypothetical protein [Chthoniobacteraceae bacterium]
SEEAIRPAVKLTAKAAVAPLEPPGETSAAKSDPEALDRLKREVLRAMKQLQSGKAVAAYQTLGKALTK